ncbi:type III-B CRISPR-associated protein Cas10/Cmr2 [Hyalangium versicolor]|uniref:type III-B CRISPR-associated protein Cas10/Cmr2 n=1 Tax=Hyalangium versicolor TaxID=2861190 RepID=UPI001CCB860C|nr:type III-B CRISPR-associated protein Cas10/Cmr2 [Hyalangium versicolor]
MPAHLLLMSLGPVQEFIAQARRTRDLWFGSHVLSELCQRAASAALERNAELIIPAILDTPESATGVPNKLLLLVKEGDPRGVAQAAREAARARLREWASQVWRDHSQLVDPTAEDAAREHVDSFLEFHAAWTSFEPGSGYAEALRRTEAALAGRKRLRAFNPWSRQRGGVHKSSLDGARESVLREGPRRGSEWKRFRIGRREQLDAIGLLKRTGGAPGQFIPVPTIGLAAYTALAQAECARELEILTAECERLRRHEILTKVREGPRGWVRSFPFDAQLLLPGRWRTHLEEQELPAAEATRFGQFVTPLLSKLGEPFPYVACLVADGDRMGDTLQDLAKHGHTAHQELSRGLSRFAAKARHIIEEKHRGVLVYAGGDDVLAFVCLPDALNCAAELHRAFSEAMSESLKDKHVRQQPTLSVGIGIGHVLESLGDLLTLGRHAEAMAKGKDRNGLALLARLHSSREHSWRGRWSDNPVKVLEAAVSLREKGALPLKKVQEVQEALRRMPAGDGSRTEVSSWGRVLTREVSRILDRVEASPGSAGLTPAAAGLLLEDSLPAEEVRARVESWAERMWLAEMLARATPRPRAPRGGEA